MLSRYLPPSTSVYSPTWKLSEPHSLWIFVEASSHRYDWLWTQSPAPLPSLEDGVGRSESSKLLIMAWSFWWPAPILMLIRSPPRVVSLEQKHFYYWGNYKGFRSSLSGAGGRDQIHISHYVTSTYSIHNWSCQGIKNKLNAHGNYHLEAYLLERKARQIHTMIFHSTMLLERFKILWEFREEWGHLKSLPWSKWLQDGPWKKGWILTCREVRKVFKAK